MVVRRIAGLVLGVLVALGAVAAPAGRHITTAAAACRTGSKLVDANRHFDRPVLNAKARAVGVVSGTGGFELNGRGRGTSPPSLADRVVHLFGWERPAGTGTVPAGTAAMSSE